MRRRLLLVLLPLLTAMLAALMVPLAQMYAARQTQDLFVAYLGHAEVYSALAEPILRKNRALAAVEHQLRAKIMVTTPGVTVSVFDSNRTTVPRVGTQRPSQASRAAADLFLVDRDPPPLETAWPWRTKPVLVGATVGKLAQPSGAIVLEVPTDAVRARVTVRIAVLAGAGLAVLLLTGLLCALPLARWILRPVHDLNATADRLAAGGLDARASEHAGPPELRGLARAFNQMADNLALALQRQRAFVADASHELRNPLATMRLRMEALAGKVLGDGERDLRLALSESDRLASVVDRLLELAHAEATAAERADFDVVSVTEQRLAAWEPALAAVGSETRLDGPAHAMARSSQDAFEYALDVLLDNARKFAPGGVIDVAIRHVADNVRVTVRDDGPGLVAEDLTHVGERFWRSAAHRAIPGTGLGLATARVLLESAGVSLEVASAGPGFEVLLRLPRATVQPLDRSAQRRGEGRADTLRSPSGD